MWRGVRFHPSRCLRLDQVGSAFWREARNVTSGPIAVLVGNPRFLILPWITIPNPGSHILALVRRRLPEGWTERYNTTPVLIEALASDCYRMLRNIGLLGKVMKIKHLLELGIFLPVPLDRARLA